MQTGYFRGLLIAANFSFRLAGWMCNPEFCISFSGGGNLFHMAARGHAFRPQPSLLHGSNDEAIPEHNPKKGHAHEQAGDGAYDFQSFADCYRHVFPPYRSILPFPRQGRLDFGPGRCPAGLVLPALLVGFIVLPPLPVGFTVLPPLPVGFIGGFVASHARKSSKS
jgi:hypothetical protein